MRIMLTCFEPNVEVQPFNAPQWAMMLMTYPYTDSGESVRGCAENLTQSNVRRLTLFISEPAARSRCADDDPAYIHLHRPQIWA